MRDWKLENLPNGKQISVIPFRMEIEEYLWRYSTISERNFRKITLPFDFKPKFPDFFGQMVSTQYFLSYIVLTFHDPTLTASFGRRAVSLVVSRVLCLSPQGVMLLRSEASWASSVSVAPTKCQTILLLLWKVLFITHPLERPSFHLWMWKLTWYFIGVCIVNQNPHFYTPKRDKEHPYPSNGEIPLGFGHFTLILTLWH